MAAKLFHAKSWTDRGDKRNSRFFAVFLQKRLQTPTSCCNGFKYIIPNEKLINVINAYSIFLGGGGRVLFDRGL